MVEQNKSVNIHTMKQEIEDDKMSRKTQEEEESEVNPYQLAILNKKPREDAKIEQMINWSIFSNRIILCGWEFLFDNSKFDHKTIR